MIFLIGSSILVCFLYSAKPSLRDWRLYAIGMLTAKNSIVFATAPATRYHALSAAQTTDKPTPHHIRISPR